MSEEKKWVLVTGARSGIGKACTEYLSTHGFNVYAGVRKDADIEELGRLQNVVAVKLDVTSDDDVQDVVKTIESRETGLYGLVNNAGISFAEPLMDVSIAELQNILDVNLLGVHRVTRAMFPFIFKSNGRVVMMSSSNGRIAFPFEGPYTMAKFGLEGYSDTFHQEMLPFGVKIILVEPGPIKTSIWDKGLELLENLKNQDHSVEILAQVCMTAGPVVIKNNKRTGKEPVEVAKAVHEALTADRPRRRYPVMDKEWQFRLAQTHPGLVDKAVLKLFNGAIKRLKDAGKA
jgi:NAD(P)-dependent dehydrogenase (short-subunit alcohol dehydrogenase family)